MLNYIAVQGTEMMQVRFDCSQDSYKNWICCFSPILLLKTNTSQIWKSKEGKSSSFSRCKPYSPRKQLLLTRLTLASKLICMYFQSNSTPLAPTHRGTRRVMMSSAVAQPKTEKSKEIFLLIHLWRFFYEK